jgi:hypothetical protein
MYMTPPIQPPLHPWTIGTSTSSLMTRQNQSFHTTGGGGTRRWSWGLDTTNRVGWRRTYFESKESGLESQAPLYATGTRLNSLALTPIPPGVDAPRRCLTCCRPAFEPTRKTSPSGHPPPTGAPQQKQPRHTDGTRCSRRQAPSARDLSVWALICFYFDLTANLIACKQI